VLILYVPADPHSAARELRKIDAPTWEFLVFSGFAGSAVGTIFFTSP
jgi:hypothetical protein